MKRELIVLFFILLTAGFFRFYHLRSTPPGLYTDEAMNGNNALEAIRTSDYKVFYPENFGREGLFINIQAQFIKGFGNHPWSLRLPAAIFGVLTVLGLYFLVRQIFNSQIAGLSSFLLAVSFWHTLFSRMGFRAIMAPFLIVWGLYFLVRGLTLNRAYYFALSAVFWGLGFYTYISFRIMPLVIIFILLSYWKTLKETLGREKYTKTLKKTITGMLIFTVVFILVCLPIGRYFLNHPQDFFGRTTAISVFKSANPIWAVLKNTALTLGQFNIVGDFNWRHNFAGSPLLAWPIGILFLIGLIRNFSKPSLAHTIILSWFFVGLMPVIFSNEGLPHALRSIIVAPAVFVFAGEGLWWLTNKLKSSKIKPFLLASFLLIITILEFNKYFYQWAKNPNTALALSQSDVNLAQSLNALPLSEIKYVIIPSGQLDFGRADLQTVFFLTDTATLEKSKLKNIFYVTKERYEGLDSAEENLVFWLRE